jgi:hypothetical protein
MQLLLVLDAKSDLFCCAVALSSSQLILFSLDGFGVCTTEKTFILHHRIMESRPPLPPFTLETATAKVQAAEDAWNTRNPQRVALAYTEDSEWRNRAEFFSGRDAIRAFLQRKWARELDYRLRKELWSFTGNRISVRFEYESHDNQDNGIAPTATNSGSSQRTA